MGGLSCPCPSAVSKASGGSGGAEGHVGGTVLFAFCVRGPCVQRLLCGSVQAVRRIMVLTGALNRAVRVEVFSFRFLETATGEHSTTTLCAREEGGGVWVLCLEMVGEG